ncbi:hypothetical protein [Pelomicrobium sp.]|jgi:hypothetical protein
MTPLIDEIDKVNWRIDLHALLDMKISMSEARGYCRNGCRCS